MRAVPRRFTALLSHSNRWATRVYWSNDGWRTTNEATFVDGTATESALSQIRWTSTLSLADVTIGASGLNPLSTQIYIEHGIDGLPLLPMGKYKLNTAEWSSDDELVSVTGSSFEWYMLADRFITTRYLQAPSASSLARRLIQEVLPGALLAWECDDISLPGLTEERDRWALIDGRTDATSIARAVGARIFAGPAGNWIARPVPTLYDAPSWEASSADVLLSHGEALSDEGVYNIVVVNGQQSDPDLPSFKPGIAMDLDPQSLTNVNKPITSGGFGKKPRFYASELITSTKQAQTTANSMLAPYLGLKQKINFTLTPDPSKEVGDVGLIHGDLGDRLALIDSLTHSLVGEPLTGETRTLATTLIGDAYVAPDDEGDNE